MVRRLNRVEYRNTIRDLMGVEFDTDREFPADDAGHGFDNIASVLTISPMLMEKYLNAAKQIVSEAVPIVSGVPVERTLEGSSFKAGDSGSRTGALALSYYEMAVVSNRVEVTHDGQYELVLNLTAAEKVRGQPVRL